LIICSLNTVSFFQQVRPVPIQATLVLVNNFIVNTTKFLNTFSESCEIKIANVSKKLNDLEITLSVLEAKLNSIPGLDGFSSSDLPSAQQTAPATQAPPASDSSAAPPAPAAAAAAAPPPPAADGVTVSTHPDYAEFFKLQRLGVPPPVIQGKMRAAGLDPSVLDTPDMILPVGGMVVASSALSVPLSRTLFNKYSNGGNSISVGQFHAAAVDHGVWLDGEALGLAIKMIDANGNGSIDYDEFLTWYKQSRFSTLSLDDASLQRRHDAAKLFQKYDDDKSGVIDRGEFMGLHKELVMKGLTRHGADKALEDMDFNRDGKIQFNELVMWLERA
jgi:WASH complex subunit CCDC53